MIDLKRTHSDKTLSRNTATGTIIEQEGTFLCSVLENGQEVAKLVATPSSTDKVLGFAKTANSTPSRTSKVETVLVPAASAPSLVAQLSEANIVTSAVRAVLSTGSVLTVISSGIPNSGEVLVSTSGAMTFHADQAASKVTVTYLFDLTVMQSKQRYGERHVNNRDLNATYGSIEVGCGFVEIFTDQFDASAAWGTGAVKLGANGTLTMSGNGPVLNLTVTHVPSASLPLLGVRGTL